MVHHQGQRIPRPATPPKLARIGAGWSTFTGFETSLYYNGTPHARDNEYGLRSDGILFRWSVGDDGGWHSAGSAGGFTNVKSMTLISKTATYDTFLANTRDGKLITIRVPVSATMKPVVKEVRTTTWQTFETLVAGPCGVNGTVVLAVDKDTKTGYLYSVGHATGLTTPITGHGKVPLTFTDPIHFRFAPPPNGDVLFGE